MHKKKIYGEEDLEVISIEAFLVAHDFVTYNTHLTI